MKKTSLTRALFVAGALAAAAGMAQADAIFYPDGTRVELGANGVENGLADSVLAQSPSTAPSPTVLASLGVTTDQSAPLLASIDDEGDTVLASGIDTTTLGAGSATIAPATRTVTTVTTTPVYVFPNINFDRHTVLSQPHPMMSHIRDMEMDRSAAATFDSPTRAGEASTMTGGAPNLVTDNEVVTGSTMPAPVVTSPDTTQLGAGSSSLSCDGGLDCSHVSD